MSKPKTDIPEKSDSLEDSRVDHQNRPQDNIADEIKFKEERNLFARVVRTIVRAKFWILYNSLITFFVFGTFLVVGYYLLLQRFEFTPDTKQLMSSIFGGLIASLGAYAMIQKLFLRRRGLGIKEWLGFGNRNVWIVPTYLSFPSPRGGTPKYYVVPPFDAQAADLLADTARNAGYRFPLRKIMGSHRFIHQRLNDNIVTFCLPDRNTYARIFLGLLTEILQTGPGNDKKEQRREILSDDNVKRFLKDEECKLEYFGLTHRQREIQSTTDPASEISFKEWMISDFTGRYLRSTINENAAYDVHEPGARNRDFCLIVKSLNPLNPEAGLLIICGIHGIGTLGGSLWIKEFKHDLFRLYRGSFQAHVLRVEYVTPEDADNYVDSSIVSIERIGGFSTDIQAYL